MIAQTERSSMIGNAAAACIERSLFNSDHARRARRVVRASPARACDAMAPNTCPRCGYPGPHPDSAGCIEALRSEIARLEFEQEVPRCEVSKPELPPSVPEPAREASIPEVTVPTSNVESSYKLVMQNLRREQVKAHEEIARLQQRAKDLDQAFAALGRLTNPSAKSDAAPAEAAVESAGTVGIYANLSVRKAILAVLTGSRRVSVAQIAEALKAGGIKTNARRFVKNVSTVLASMKTAGEVRRRAAKWSLAQSAGIGTPVPTIESVHAPDQQETVLSAS